MTKGSEMERADKDDLDRLFAEARAEGSSAQPDFMARVLADALAMQPAAAGFAAPEVARPSLWARLAQALGGAAVAAGLGTAAMAGLALGYVQPEPVLTLAGSYGLAAGGEVFDLLPGYDSLLAEE